MIYLFRVSFGVHLPKAALRSNANIANRIPKICDERVSVAPTLRRHSGWNVHVVWRPSVVNECSSRHDKHGAHATRSSIRHQSFSRAVAAAAHIFHNVNGATVKRKPEATHTHTHTRIACSSGTSNMVCIDPRNNLWFKIGFVADYCTIVSKMTSQNFG